MSHSVGRIVLVAVAIAVAGVATAVAVAPISDSGVQCGAALIAAVHGKDVAPLGPGGHYVVLSKQQQKLLAPGNAGLFGLSGNRLPQGISFMSVVCRAPARHRLAFVVTGLGVSMIVVGLGWRFFDPRRRSVPVDAP